MNDEIIKKYKQVQVMGNETLKSSPSSSSSSHHQYKVTERTHPDLYELQHIYSVFNNQPIKFIQKIDLSQSKSECCQRTSLKLYTLQVELSLDNLLVIKRNIKKDFTERQLWYVVKAMGNIFSLMQKNEIAMGAICAQNFHLHMGRFLRLQILHLLPNNEHVSQIHFTNYYSPEFISSINDQSHHLHNINIYKSQVFSFGLLLLEIATCPLGKPKFHNHTLKEVQWKQIWKRMQETRLKYSKIFFDLLQIMLREDIRTRPDWNYLKVWTAIKQKQCIDVAPCIFWSI